MSEEYYSNFGAIVLMQIGIFLSGSVGFIVGTAWNDLFQTSLAIKSIGQNAERINPQLSAKKQQQLKHALIVTGVALGIMIAWVFLISRINPKLIKL